MTDINENLAENQDGKINNECVSINKEEFTASKNLTIYGNDVQKAKMFKAMALYYGEVENPENTTLNTFFKAKYAPLNEVLNATRPVMSKFGLACTQTTSMEDGDCVVSTLLTHEDGGCIFYPVLKAKPSKADVQGVGATLTYLRRFALNAVAGVCGEVDDDGNNAAGNADPKAPPQSKKQSTPKDKLVAACKSKAAVNRKAVDAVIKEFATSGAIKDIPEDKIEAVIKKIEEIKE